MIGDEAGKFEIPNPIRPLGFCEDVYAGWLFIDKDIIEGGMIGLVMPRGVETDESGACEGGKEPRLGSLECVDLDRSASYRQYIQAGGTSQTSRMPLR